MSVTIGVPQLEIVPGTRLKRLTRDFRGYSDVLEQWFVINAGFVCDEESTPWNGEDSIAGIIHDWLSRYDSLPVSKWTASRVYQEFQYYEDSMVERHWYTKAWDWIGRGVKAGFVGICPDFVYWHKYSVHATAEEMES